VGGAKAFWGREREKAERTESAVFALTQCEFVSKPPERIYIEGLLRLGSNRFFAARAFASENQKSWRAFTKQIRQVQLLVFPPRSPSSQMTIASAKIRRN